MQKNVWPIAYIENDFKEKFGIPRQSGRAPSVLSKVVFLPEYRSIDAIRGLEEFSHVWLIFDFSKSHCDKFSPTVRPPRLGGNKRVGVFASRSPFRPNSLGLSCVKIERIELRGDNAPFLVVSGADILNGTPIYDIKPYLPHADCIAHAKGGYSTQAVNHKLIVEFEDGIEQIIDPNSITPLKECLADDPRPSYQEGGRIYGMTFANYNIKFIVNDNVLTVISVQKV